MMFPHFTLQQVTIDGTWQTTDPHRTLTGTLSSSASFVILSLLHCGEMYHYMKHTKCHALDVSFEPDIPHWPSHSEEYLTSYNRM
jgi:hypothetical protein